MEPYLNVDEAMRATNAFLRSIYGHETYTRWRDLKLKMNFQTEHEFVDWILDFVQDYQEQSEYFNSSVSGRGEAEGVYEQRGEAEGGYEHSDGTITEPHNKKRKTVREMSVNDDVVVLSSDVSCKRDVEGVTEAIPYEESFGASYEEAGSEQVDSRYALEAVSEGSLEDSLGLAYDGTGVAVARRRLTSKHSSVHSAPDPGKPHRCDLCGMGFKLRTSLASHVKQVHQKERAVCCSYCDHSSFNQYNLNIHMVRRHGLKTNFQCPNCGKYEITEKYLHIHMGKCGGEQRRDVKALTSATTDADIQTAPAQ